MRSTMLALCLTMVVAASVGPTAQDVTALRNRVSFESVPREFQFLFGAPLDGSNDTKAAWDRLPFDTISLERTPCLGSCPAYKVTFYRATPNATQKEGDERFGRAELAGGVPAWVEPGVRLPPGARSVLGAYTGRIDLWAFARLSYLIQKTGFSQMASRYDAGWTDDSSTIVAVTGRGINKTVTDYGRVGPIELWGVQEAIDAAVTRIDWVKTDSR